MPDLITAAGYVAQWGYKETGQLLTRTDIVDDTTVDTNAAYQAAMETDGALNANIVTALNTTIDRAEAVIKAHVEQLYVYPPEASSVSTTSAILNQIAYVFTRFFLHDEASDRGEMPKVVTSVYQEYMKILEDISNGKKVLIGLDRQPSSLDFTLYAI